MFSNTTVDHRYLNTNMVGYLQGVWDNFDSFVRKKKIFFVTIKFNELTKKVTGRVNYNTINKIHSK